jgi:hypothetical protein
MKSPRWNTDQFGIHGIPTAEWAYLDSWWFKWVLWGKEKDAMILPA